MTEDEQAAICKAVTIACMWGHGGIASVIMEELDKVAPMPEQWQAVYNRNARAVKREHMGVLTDEARLRGYLRRGYWLTNYDEDGCSLFNPPPMNGLCMYVSKELAEKFRRPNPYTDDILSALLLRADLP